MHVFARVSQCQCTGAVSSGLALSQVATRNFAYFDPASLSANIMKWSYVVIIGQYGTRGFSSILIGLLFSNANVQERDQARGAHCYGRAHAPRAP